MAFKQMAWDFQDGKWRQTHEVKVGDRLLLEYTFIDKDGSKLYAEGGGYYRRDRRKYNQKQIARLSHRGNVVTITKVNPKSCQYEGAGGWRGEETGDAPAYCFKVPEGIARSAEHRKSQDEARYAELLQKFGIVRPTEYVEQLKVRMELEELTRFMKYGFEIPKPEPAEEPEILETAEA